MKQLIALFLAAILLLSTVSANGPLLISPNPNDAAGPVTDLPNTGNESFSETPVHTVDPAAEIAARELYDLGLFKGSGTDGSGDPIFSLERTLTRQEAVIMLVRLLGKESEALASGYPSPFEDHADWAEPYVSYAWVFSLTIGNGDGTFCGEETATVAQYITFLLRALGYNSPGDFSWDQALAKACEIGLNDGRWTEPSAPISRADAVILSRLALDLNIKGGALLRETINDSAAVEAGYRNNNPTFSGKGGSSVKGGIIIDDQAGKGYSWKKAINAANDLNISANDGKIRVLIVHTHATESYSEADGLVYKDSGDHRTLDRQRNMLQVGKVIADALNNRGIGTVQITEVHDYPNYNGAYDRSRESISKYLALYPDVEMVIDIHRDAARYNGLPLRSKAAVNGFNTAQLMFVCASGYSEWKGHLGIALGIHDILEQRYPGLMRPVNLRKNSYNQNMTPGSLLVEVGTDGNTLSEALYSARLLADGIADYLISH